jgi:hypothetical protein
MARPGKTPLEQLVGSSYFDAFKPLRQMLEMKEQADRVLGHSALRDLSSITAGPNSKLIDSVNPPLGSNITSLLGESALEKLSVGIGAKSLVGETIKQLNSGGVLSELTRQADLYGGLRLDGALADLHGLRQSTLIGSAVLSNDQLQQISGLVDTRSALQGLVGTLRFEPGEMLSQIGGLDGKALMLGREATLDAVRAPEIRWPVDDLYGLSDLVAPVRSPEGELVSAAFPPDLVEDEPLSSEFEVDAIVAEHQTGAQVFLALRSPRAAERMASARQRLIEGDDEALAQSTTSCRRALHALADTVYPARKGKVKDRSGKERAVHGEAFKNRLLMFLSEGIPTSRMLELAEAKLDLVVTHLDLLARQLDKGVHADVIREEAIQAYVETWAVIAHVAQVVSADGAGDDPAAGD